MKAEKVHKANLQGGLTREALTAFERLSANGAVSCVSAERINTLKSCRAAVVYNIGNKTAAEEVRAKLSSLFGAETDCEFICGESVSTVKIKDLPAQKAYGAECAAAVEEAEFLKKDRYDYADLEQMVKLLRAPGGCPWDRVQTSESIKGNMIEEAYELVDAIERGDSYDMEEETGDVLLQAAFHSVMEEEKGGFTGADALTRVVKKLIFRHSHIFGADKAGCESEALGVWENNKRKEKGQETYADTVTAVPKNMPACMRAQKVGKRSAKSGMDFPSPKAASVKLAEEVDELLAALEKGDKSAIFDEAGDVLYSAVNTCRLAGVDCELALHAAVEKFTKRFVEFERLAKENGEKIEDMEASRWDYYWALSKDAVK